MNWIPTKNVTDEIVQENILKQTLSKSSVPDEMHPQISIEIVDHTSKALALVAKKDDGWWMYTTGPEYSASFTNV